MESVSEKFNDSFYDDPTFKLLFSSVTGVEERIGTMPYLDWVETGKSDSGDIPSIGMSSFSKSFELKNKTIRVKSSQPAIPGVDVKAMFNSVILDERRQSISREAIKKMFELGKENMDNLDIEWNPSLTDGPRYRDVPVTFKDNPWQWFLNLFKPVGRKYIKTIQASPLAPPSHSDLARRLLVKLSGARQTVYHTGRIGLADTVICNSKVATILQDSPSFAFDNHLSGYSDISNGAIIRRIGSIFGMSVMVDPYMEWSDTRALLYRRGDKMQPGLHLVYQKGSMKQREVIDPGIGTNTINESNEAIVTTGHAPCSNYIVVDFDVPEHMI